MKKSYFIKGIVLSLLVIGVETGKASLNRKCSKAATQTKTILTTRAATALHFTPLDVVKW